MRVAEGYTGLSGWMRWLYPGSFGWTQGLAHCLSHRSGIDYYSVLPGEPLLLEFRSSLVQMRAAVKSCDGKDCGPEAPLPPFLPNRIPPSWP